MNTDKAYILGLIIGGGIWGNSEDIFRIRLPYKQWGSYTLDPSRAGQISKDILQMVGPLFRAIYGITVSYDTSVSGAWNILCEGDLTDLKNELEAYGVICEGEVRKTANINNIVQDLVDDNLKRRFIAGLADTIGSTNKSHRRFNDDKQILSFEISGFAFEFVCSLCKLLHSIKSYPDQILWNHPNFHTASNPYNPKWKKGFKLRVFLDQYQKFGAFAFTSKALSAKENRKLQSKENKGIPCPERKINNPSVSCVHPDERSNLLPPEIRGGHYLHNRHVCAVLRCPNAPIDEVQKIINQAEHYINPFPVLVKGTKQEITNIIRNNELMKSRKYESIEIKIRDIVDESNTNIKAIFGNDAVGYPINIIILATTYLIAAVTNNLKGTRPNGRKEDIISNYLRDHPDETVIVDLPDLATPIVISKSDYSTIVGPHNPSVYKKLITKSPDNPYKISVREIVLEDLI